MKRLKAATISNRKSKRVEVRETRRGTGNRHDENEKMKWRRMRAVGDDALKIR